MLLRNCKLCICDHIATLMKIGDPKWLIIIAGSGCGVAVVMVLVIVACARKLRPATVTSMYIY